MYLENFGWEQFGYFVFFLVLRKFWVGTVKKSTLYDRTNERLPFEFGLIIHHTASVCEKKHWDVWASMKIKYESTRFRSDLNFLWHQIYAVDDKIP